MSLPRRCASRPPSPPLREWKPAARHRWKLCRAGASCNGKIRVRAKRPHGLMHDAARAQIADERDEVAAVGIEEVEQLRVVLAAARVAVVADRFERQHRADVVTALAGELGVDAAALLV